MDTLTHGLLGALVVRAVPGRRRISRSRASLAAAAAAAFPDIDYLTFWIDPLRFLADWHRGPTHSLLLAPLWAVVVGWLCASLFGDRANIRGYWGICLLGLLSHIAADLLTTYGTQILAPLSDWKPGFGITFVIDPYFSAIVSLGLLASLGWAPALWARTGLLLLVLYLGLQSVQQHQAEAIGVNHVRLEGLVPARSDALAQPLSPFNWLIIISEGDRYHVARVNLTREDDRQPVGNRGWPGRLWSAYRAPEARNWERYYRFGETDRVRELARSVWQADRFAEFRRFARYPVLYGIDRLEAETCVWFTDLRYVLPGLIPPFRYGMCGTGEVGKWELYRLRRFTGHARQLLHR